MCHPETHRRGRYVSVVWVAGPHGGCTNRTQCVVHHPWPDAIQTGGGDSSFELCSCASESCGSCRKTRGILRPPKETRHQDVNLVLSTNKRHHDKHIGDVNMADKISRSRTRLLKSNSSNLIKIIDRPSPLANKNSRKWQPMPAQFFHVHAHAWRLANARTVLWSWPCSCLPFVHNTHACTVADVHASLCLLFSTTLMHSCWRGPHLPPPGRPQHPGVSLGSM